MKKIVQGLVVAVLINTVLFVYGYGALNNQVKANVKQLDESKVKIECAATKDDLIDTRDQLKKDIGEKMIDLKQYMTMLYQKEGNS